MNDVERYQGCLLGLACGDAVGTTVEFRSRGSFAPVTGMQGGGPFGLIAGEWTDDTSMALCLAASLIHCKGFDAVDQMNRYCNWRSVGYLSSTGNCFDIGLTVSGALTRYLASGDPFAGDPDPRTAGNGALMRLAPVPMFYAASAPATWKQAGESTRTTHGAQEAIECSQLFALQLRSALRGEDKAAILSTEPLAPLSAKVAALAGSGYASKPVEQIRGSGYCVESLEAALWCFANTGSFEEAVLAAANLGDDADTTAAICGQLAGAFYGVGGIPRDWLDKLVMRDDIERMAGKLLTLAG
ncbi:MULTISPECIES: ADP-ribosylglycohydrolase family protein [unclassified Variovorax]|jgi:ADP-ribosyl-[dinitrogen reductase] hydrolase|uniref:ADP-ribosylglycohydrolase family protein n=1 Tax=unclassified Variovorax TaxID=663243 RepID=UPI000F7F1D5E|nr:MULTISPECIES: ADP-ribosylglycohydrolase family protein [unclassified Variovorax]RSZ39810.1 ADP-ribosylglycohydrolase family protein [Variovorax sp. 553]RSZ40483.1 ADP-ribosylglycohydrolase family protein [Variovorax sp. 679]